jgi:ligand-binding sensor domain-containing protein
VYAIAIDVEGNKWFGTNSGILKFDGTTWKTYTTTDGLVDNSVISIAIDAEGNKWFGTWKGVSRFDGNQWVNYTMADGLLSNNTQSVAIDAEGNKWFGTYYGGVSKFDGTNWTTGYIPNGGQQNNTIVNSIAIDAEGNKWFATDDGVRKLEGTLTAIETSAPSLSSAVFPNPFKNKTSITFSMQGPFHLLINDGQGREVKRIAQFHSGEMIDMEAFDSGIYFYQAINDKETAVFRGKLFLNK